MAMYLYLQIIDNKNAKSNVNLFNINMKKLLIKKNYITLKFSYRALILNGMFCSNTWRLDTQIILVEHCKQTSICCIF